MGRTAASDVMTLLLGPILLSTVASLLATEKPPSLQGVVEVGLQA